ncbi:MAG: PIN domain-containing protein [bacterium]
MKTVFFDLNVILDIFWKREPFYGSSARVFGLVEHKQCHGYLGALSYPTLFYLLRKEKSPTVALTILKKVRIVLKTAPVLEKTIDSALSSGFGDFEDAIQYYAALEAQSDYFITRNKKDFPPGRLPILLPEEFLAQLKLANA